jgi:tRNA 2-thiouridine synthesizing protein A
LPVAGAAGKKALRQVPVGDALVLECTDPLTVIDVPHFAAQTGNDLVAQERRDELYLYRIIRRR